MEHHELRPRLYTTIGRTGQQDTLGRLGRSALERPRNTIHRGAYQPKDPAVRGDSTDMVAAFVEPGYPPG
jgi:hypothetical protein